MPQPSPVSTAHAKGDDLYARASQIAPGGAAASVRLNRALDRVLYLARGDGAWIYDVDGNPYLDFCTSHGASILGHGHPAILQSVARSLEMGVLCSHETEHHVALAGKVCDMVPGAEMVRLSGSGTESVMHALRLARAVTGRDKLIKFEGHFHGYSEHVYWSTSPPAEGTGPPDSPVPYCQSAGIPRGLQDYVVVVPFNNPDALERAIRTHRDDAAAVILEPVNYNSGCILPRPGFLKAVRQLTADNDLLLIFDEVLTAFRIAPGGAQEVYDVIPDLAILGKAIGGGLPISAIVGKRDVMCHLRPLGDAEHSGTYMGHLVPVMGALACLTELSAPGVYPRLYALGDRLYRGLEDAIGRSGIRARLQHLGPRFFIYFGLDPDRELQDYRSGAAIDRAATLAFSRETAARGVYFHDYGGGLAHHGFSAAHTEDDIDTALEAVEGALKAVA